MSWNGVCVAWCACNTHKKKKDSSVMFHKQNSDNPNKFIMHTRRVICFVTAARFITSETFLTVERRKGNREGRSRPADRRQHDQA